MQVEDLRFNVIGDILRLPTESQTILSDIVEETKNNTGITLTIALIY
jgi:undecaprenyl pyrophosphate synthase